LVEARSARFWWSGEDVQFPPSGLITDQAAPNAPRVSSIHPVAFISSKMLGAHSIIAVF
jgi:hypothetical protein